MSEHGNFDPSAPVDVTPDGAAGGAPGGPAPATPMYETRRHPFRGLLAAIPLAIGVTIILLVTKTISLSITGIIATMVIVLVLGTLWGTFGPASKPKGLPPEPPTAPQPPQPQVSTPEPGTPASPSTESTDWSAPSN